MDLKIDLPNLQEKKKVELKYTGGDIHIQITGNSDSELIRKIKEEIKKDKSEEEIKLRQLIGGEMIND